MLKLLFRANTAAPATIPATSHVSYEASLIANNTTEKTGVNRLLFIDNLRWVMIILVLSMHAAVTYSHLGSWYFMEATPVSNPELFIFGTYQAWLQSFFMGFLFFISGYFVPKAYDTKGAIQFLKDRGYRLGLPLLFFVFILQPVAIYCIFLFDAPATVPQFTDLYYHYIVRMNWLGGTGPLWFCEALLIFCIGYALYRVITKNTAIKTPAMPGKKKVWLFIAMIALGSFLVRIPWPNGTNFYNLQFCYFTQYIFFFCAGVMAYRGDWLRKMPAAMGNYWAKVAVAVGMALWIVNIVFGGALKGDMSGYQGGWHWQSLVECCREQLVGVGLSLFFLVWFRERFNQQGPAARFFSANAFAVYVFHTPVMIALSKMIIAWHLPLLLKFVVLTAMTAAVTYALSELILRKLPFLKNIL